MSLDNYTGLVVNYNVKVLGGGNANFQETKGDNRKHLNRINTCVTNNDASPRIA